MPLGLIGKKCGMTRVFTEEGASVPVSVIEVASNVVSQVKSVEKDGYRAIQIAYDKKSNSKVSKPQAGHFAKAGVEAGKLLKEFRLADDELPDVTAGHELTVEMFEAGQKIDVAGTTRGKGFAGVVKRHNFHMQDATHGNSISHRAPGSIGQCQTPGRVFKGKKMAGHMGNVQRTVQLVEVVKVDADRKLILIKGAIPGAPGGVVVVTPSVKTKTQRGES